MSTDPFNFGNAPIRENPAERGMALAQKTERDRVKQVLQGAMSDVKRTTLLKSVNQPGRDAYDRAFNRLEAAAQNWADISGEELTIPVRDAPAPFPRALHDWAADVARILLEKHKIKIPPLLSPETTQIIRPRGPQDGRYKETKGLSPDGTGLPMKGPGSQIDPEWSNA